jgi:hypothetical protein
MSVLKSRSWRVIASVVFVTMVVSMVSVTPASAATPLQCQISMQTNVSFVPVTHRADYTVVLGGGSCSDDLGGTYVASVIGGTGHSAGLGPGTNCPTSDTQDFTLTVSLTLTSTSTGLSRTVAETFSAPGIVPLPGSAPVTTTSPTKTSGAGVFSYRVFHECPPDGNGATLYVGTIAN